MIEANAAKKKGKINFYIQNQVMIDSSTMLRLNGQLIKLNEFQYVFE